MINKQKIFDNAFCGLRSQGFEQSVDEVGVCVYRSASTGRRCAIGFSIPDEKYEVGMEKYDPAFSPLIEILGSAEDEVPEADVEFLGELQLTHDVHQNPLMMERALLMLAKDYKLTIPKVSKL